MPSVSTTLRLGHFFIVAGVIFSAACNTGSADFDDALDSAGGNSAGGSGGSGSVVVSGGGSVGVGGSPAANCGNSTLDLGVEACDDGNNVDGDGCQANCLAVEPGYICREAGVACDPYARCGDGVVAFPEQCDDGAKEAGDGCSPSCKVELGFKCDPGKPCEPTTCGDGVIEGAETCDNGPDTPDDLCSPACVGEPDCTNGACTSSCGDGVVIDEACDDGNLLDGDGCSSTCQVEPGYDCSAAASCTKDASGNCVLTIPAVFRDFSSAHSDFQTCTQDSVVTGMVKNELVDGKPVPNGSGDCWQHLDEWYIDTQDNVRKVGNITLYDNGDGRFVNRWGEHGEQWTYFTNFVYAANTVEECSANGCVPCGWNPAQGCTADEVHKDGDPLFFPVDGIPGALDEGGHEAVIGDEYGEIGWPTEQQVLGGEKVLHNFYFTTEVTYWFPYEADTAATLDFTGDDDVWVFVNHRLAVDLGGTHPPANGSVTLDASTASAFGLEPGNIYEIKVFHAERKLAGSSFRLTLDGFSATRSECVAMCGDGIIGYGEECDDGVNDGGYNECQPGCLLGTYCGDGIVQEGEECDDAVDMGSSCSGCRYVVVK